MEGEGEFEDEPPQHEAELESPEVMPEEDDEDEEDEDEEGTEEASTPRGASRQPGGAAKSEGYKGSPPPPWPPKRGSRRWPGGCTCPITGHLRGLLPSEEGQ